MFLTLLAGQLRGRVFGLQLGDGVQAEGCPTYLVVHVCAALLVSTPTVSQRD